MEAIGQLTAGLAHDFNNLLQVVTGNLERLRKNPASERAPRYLENATLAAERGARLTRQLLAFARKTRLEPQPVDLSDLVTDIQEMIESTVGGRAELQLSLRQRLPRANVDPTHLEMALLNLVINARDASTPGGVITISTGPLRDPPETRHLPPGDYVVLCVEDEGVGMPPHIVERAAEPFFSTKGRMRARASASPWSAVSSSSRAASWRSTASSAAAPPCASSCRCTARPAAPSRPRASGPPPCPSPRARTPTSCWSRTTPTSWSWRSRRCSPWVMR
ncbi:ATP-binding protein [Phenylobacterium sp. J426]|nr:ATP-binding protein [Phenylobacterium sp. J426]